MASGKHNLWDESPSTLTEFGPLSSDMKPTGGFLQRLWKKGKGGEDDRSGSSSRAGSSPSSRESSVERRPSSQMSATANDRPSTLSKAVFDRVAGKIETEGSQGTDAAEESPLTAESPDLSVKEDMDESASAGGESSDDTPEVGAGQNLMLDVRMTRNLSSVLNRLGNILDRRSSTPQTYKDSDFKQYWMPDSSCKECYDCGDRFTTFRRRHHCRICGQIFCSRCCNQELPGKIIGFKGGIRVCEYCCKVVLRYAQQSVSTGEVKVFKEEIARNMSSSQLDSIETGSGSFEFGLWSPVSKRRPMVKEELTLPQQRSLSSPDTMAAGTADKSAPFDLTPQSEFASQECLLSETKILTQDSVQLRILWNQLQDPDRGVEMQAHRVRLRTHQNCMQGRDLVDWLIRNDKGVKREQAVAIGQALMFVGYIEPIGNQLPIFRDDFTLYKPGDMPSTEAQPTLESLTSVPEESSEPLWLQEIDSNDDIGDPFCFTVSVGEDQRASTSERGGRQSISSESDGRTPASSFSSKSEMGSVQELPKLFVISREAMEEPLPRQDLSTTGMCDDFFKGTLSFLSRPPVQSSDPVACPQGWRTVEKLREENGEKLAYERLKQAHTEHLQIITRQLLSQKGLSASWESVILNCVHQITHFVRPDVRVEGDDLDIRKYIHIKKIPVGQKQDTSLIHGLMFTKNIAHKKMKQQIGNPHILLLRGAIEYQRVENKFSSLEPQILQEKEFLKNSVAKIAAFHPSIVVVEKSVSRLAQEFLLDAGITLVFNVKFKVIQRLARFTQADIVESIDGLVSKPNLGFCHDFHCQTYTLPNKEIKTVAVFAGCATHLGCTVRLTGAASLSELKRVKVILNFMTYVAYNSLLELCFAMDEFALPPPGSEELDKTLEGFESSTDTDANLSSANLTSNTEEEPLEIVEVTDDQEDGIMLSASQACSAGVTLLFGMEKGAVTDVNDVKDDDDDEDNKGGVDSNGKEMSGEAQVEYTSFQHEEEEEKEADKENVAPTDHRFSAAAASSSPRSSALTVPSMDAPFMQRQLSKVQELTEFTDPLREYQKNQDESIFKRSQSIQFQEHKQPLWHQFRQTLHGTLLSASPYIKYSVPHLESELGCKCELRKFLPEQIYWSALFTGEPTPKEQQRQSNKAKFQDLEYSGVARYPTTNSGICITEAHPFVLNEMTAPANEVSTLTLLADFRARGGRIHISAEGKIYGTPRDNASKPKKENEVLEETLTADSTRSGICWVKKTDCLDIWNHQRLSVLFSSYSYKSPNHPNPCVYPWVVTMSYYGRNDITLGGFLERFCFRESYACPSPTCDVPMVDHIRRFVHGQGCINVLLKKLDSPVPGAQENILLWSWCRRCKQVTPVVQISPDTWNLSFAKYLDLRFHSLSFRRRASAEPCSHSLHLDHYQYFGHKDIVASFKYSSVILRELALPALVVQLIRDPLDVPAAINAVRAISSKGIDRFSLLLEITMKMKSEATGDSAAKVIADFLTEQQAEKNKFKDAANLVQVKLTQLGEEENRDQFDPCYDILDSIVQLKRMTSESVQRWNTRIQDFMNSQQRRSKAKQKDKDFASSCDERDVEKERPTSKGFDDRTVSIAIISMESPNLSLDLRGSDEVKPGSSPKNISILAAAEPVKDVQSNGSKTEADDVDGSWFSSAKRWLTSSGFTPLALPFQPSEHHLLPPCDRVPVVVFDQEPSSIIAYALSCSDYQLKLRELQTYLRASAKDIPMTSMLYKNLKDKDPGGLSVDAMLETDDLDGLSLMAGNSAAADSGADKNKPSKQPCNIHIELQFSDSSAKFYCRVYFAEQFRKLRKHVFPDGEEMFIRSLSRCKPWEAKGGKSGSTFCKTDDDRFIMKQMSSMEADSFEKFGPQYFQYVTKACSDKNPTALAKILGVFRIGFRNTQTNSTLKQDLLVMENLFYNRKISQKFDLKGSVRNRLVNTAGKQAEEELVLLDENLLKWSVDSPLYLRPHSKSVLKMAITNDSQFLSKNLVMDYSLLVGLDDSTKELVVGIIDYIRTFTWDKKLEMVFKSNLPGQGKMPTVVSPQLYKNRFLEAMERYFLHVPDQWNGLGRDSPVVKEDAAEDQEADAAQTSGRR